MFIVFQYKSYKMNGFITISTIKCFLDKCMAKLILSLWHQPPEMCENSYMFLYDFEYLSPIWILCKYSTLHWIQWICTGSCRLADCCISLPASPVTLNVWNLFIIRIDLYYYEFIFWMFSIYFWFVQILNPPLDPVDRADWPTVGSAYLHRRPCSSPFLHKHSCKQDANIFHTITPLTDSESKTRQQTGLPLKSFPGEVFQDEPLLVKSWRYHAPVLIYSKKVIFAWGNKTEKSLWPGPPSWSMQSSSLKETQCQKVFQQTRFQCVPQSQLLTQTSILEYAVGLVE